MGTDTGFGAEGLADHTHFAHVYDHVNAVLYWRDSSNLQLQRVSLSEMALGAGANVTSLWYNSNTLPYFNNASAWFV